MKNPIARRFALSLLAAALVGGGCVGYAEHGYAEQPEEDIAKLEGPTRVVVRGAPVVLVEGQTEQGNLVVVGGEARVDGTVRGSLVVVGGRLDVGPRARVEQDLVAVGNEHLNVAATARVGRSEVLADLPGVASILQSALFAWDHPLFVLLVALATLGLVGWVAYRRVVRRYDDAKFHEAFAQRPVRAGLIGFGLHIAFWALGLAALLSGWLTGIALAAWFVGSVAWAIGWVLAGVHVGRRLAARRGWRGSPAGHALAGVGIWLLICMIPVAGWIAAMLGSFVGFGALVSPRSDVPASRAPEPSFDALPATAA
jgi:hypothetical protein